MSDRHKGSLRNYDAASYAKGAQAATEKANELASFRIAAALERIADALEKKTGVTVHVPDDERHTATVPKTEVEST